MLYDGRRWFLRNVHHVGLDPGILPDLDEYRTWWPSALPADVAPAADDAAFGDVSQVWIPAARIVCRFIPCFFHRNRHRLFSLCLLPLSAVLSICFLVFYFVSGLVLSFGF